jgi:hypothetical protein
MGMYDSDDDYGDEGQGYDEVGDYDDEDYEDQLDTSEEAMAIRMHNDQRMRQA